MTNKSNWTPEERKQNRRMAEMMLEHAIEENKANNTTTKQFFHSVMMALASLINDNMISMDEGAYLAFKYVKVYDPSWIPPTDFTQYVNENPDIFETNYKNVKNESGSMILDRDDLFELIDQRMEDRSWWVIITDLEMTKLIQTIENKFYKPGTDRNRDFELVINKTTPVIFARKSRMTFDQFVKTSRPWINKRVLKDLDEVRKRKADCFMMPSSVESWRTITDFVFQFNDYHFRKQIESGKIKLEDKKCEFNHTIPAELEGEQNNICTDKVVAMSEGLTTNGQLRGIWLCEKHFKRLDNWTSKQPDFY